MFDGSIIVLEPLEMIRSEEKRVTLKFRITRTENLLCGFTVSRSPHQTIHPPSPVPSTLDPAYHAHAQAIDSSVVQLLFA